MTFERIKTIRGHQYKYLVENVRENGKTKQKIVKYFGRVDKTQENISGVNIPDGLYYFVQATCGGCASEAEIRDELDIYRQVKGDIPELYYIDVHKDISPLPILVPVTPTWIFVKNGLISVGSNTGWYSFWRKYLGDELYDKAMESAVARDRLTEKSQIIEEIRKGVKFRELRKLGHDAEIIRECLDEFKKGAGCEGGVCPLP